MFNNTYKRINSNGISAEIIRIMGLLRSKIYFDYAIDTFRFNISNDIINLQLAMNF